MFLVFFCTMLALTRQQDIHPRIYAGHFANDKEFPFIVSLLYGPENAHFCGGSIISKTWVVTAAHCLAPIVPEMVEVVAGVTRISGRSQSDNYAVQKIVSHPFYISGAPGFQNDIGLIQTKRPFRFSDAMKPISIGNFHEEHDLLTAGWGVYHNDQITADVLRYIEMRVTLTAPHCIYNAMTFCATTTNGKIQATTCSGDSGGPVIDKVTAELVGIVSFGWMDCDNKSTILLPDQYMRVDFYKKWICNNTDDLESCKRG